MSIAQILVGHKRALMKQEDMHYYWSKEDMGLHLWKLAQAIQRVDVWGCCALKSCQGVIVQFDLEDCIYARL